MNEKFQADLVSIIIPTFNSALYIDKTLQSAINQSYKNIEIVVVDDCSSDNTVEVVTNFALMDSRIKLIRQLENRGAGVSRSVGLANSIGQYVAFLDADDIWIESKIEQQIDLMKEKNNGFSFTAIKMVDEHGKEVKNKIKVKEKVDYKFLLKNTMIATSSVVIDRFIKGDFSMSDRRGGQDYSTWLKLLRDGSFAYGIDEALVKYRINNEHSLSSNKFKSIKQVWEIQTADEKISKMNAFINIIFFAYNALKKYFF